MSYYADAKDGRAWQQRVLFQHKLVDLVTLLWRSDFSHYIRCNSVSSHRFPSFPGVCDKSPGWRGFLLFEEKEVRKRHVRTVHSTVDFSRRRIAMTTASRRRWAPWASSHLDLSGERKKKKSPGPLCFPSVWVFARGTTTCSVFFHKGSINITHTVDLGARRFASCGHSWCFQERVYPKAHIHSNTGIAPTNYV